MQNDDQLFHFFKKYWRMLLNTYILLLAWNMSFWKLVTKLTIVAMVVAEQFF